MPDWRTAFGLRKSVGCSLSSQSHVSFFQVCKLLLFQPSDSCSSYLKSGATGREWELVHDKGIVFHNRDTASTVSAGQLHRVQDNGWQGHIPRDSNGKLAIWCAMSCHWRKRYNQSRAQGEKEAQTSQQRQGQQALQVLLPVTPKASAKHSKTNATSSNSNTDSGHNPRSVAIHMKGPETSAGHSIPDSQKHSPKPPAGLVHTIPALPGK